PDVSDVLLEQVDAARDVAVEEERLGEPDRIILRARSGLDRHREAFAAPHEVRRLEGQLSEHAFELGHAGAEGELIAILLFELELDINLVWLGRRLLNVDLSGLPLERLEVAELVEPFDAELQRLGVEDAVFEQADFAPDDVVVRG